MASLAYRGAPARPATPATTPSRWRAVAAAIWRFAESYGHARAAGDLHRLANVYETFNPELATRLRDAAVWRD